MLWKSKKICVMNGNKWLVDTNILIALTSGRKDVISLLEGKNIFISVISEIELLSWPKLSAKDVNLIKQMLSEFTVIELNGYVKNETIKLRRKFGLKLPDALIAASSIANDLPLLTFDKGFKRLTGLNLILLDF